MDKYKIVFVCRETPNSIEGLKGFSKGEYYEGRSFNGLYEVNAKWGSGAESKLISKKLFDEYFELIENESLVKTPA